MPQRRTPLHRRIISAMKTFPSPRTFRSLLVAAILLLTAHRLPAPIQEVAPTATPRATPKPVTRKPKPVPPELKTKATPRPSPTPVAQGPARFAGVWTGTINQGILGNLEMTLIINAAGTSVKESSSAGTHTHRVTVNGDVMTWKAGWLNEITWTFTPAGDGKTAAVTSKSGFGVNGASIFRKQ